MTELLELREAEGAFEAIEGWLRERGFFRPGGERLVADVYLGYGLSQSIRREAAPSPPEPCDALPFAACRIATEAAPAVAHEPFSIGEWERTWTAAEYAAAVESVRSAIARGDVYQVNLVQHLSAPFAGDPRALVAALSLFARKGFAARAAAILALPAALVVAAHRLIRGSLPLRDFDFTLLARPADLAPRIGQSLEAVVRGTPAAAWVGLAALAVLVAAGRATPAGSALLALAACGLAAYLFLPALAVEGPAWLVETAFFRTTAALAPLLAAGVTVRLLPVFGGSTGSAPGPAASAASPGPPTPSTPGS